MNGLLRPLAAAVFVAAGLAQQPPEFRLPGTVRPVQYSAELTVVPAQDSFSRVIDIGLEVRESTALIWLNASGLTIRQASLTQGGDTLAARAVAGGSDFAGFAFERPVSPGAGVLHVVYSGQISSRSSAGIFRNQVAGEWYAFTQFEAGGQGSAAHGLLIEAAQPRVDVLVVVANNAAIDVCRVGDGVDNVAIEQLPAQPPGDGLRDAPSAAAKLPVDGQCAVFHRCLPYN